MAITGSWTKGGVTLTPLHHAILGIAALALIGGATAAAVTLFGDERHAGPRKVLSLAAAGDTSAARVTVSEAAVDPMAAAAEDAAFFEPEGEILPEADAPEAPSRPGPKASPLPKAPLAGFFQNGPNGPLPIVTPDGRTPARAYARPFTGDATKPKIAIIVGGLGFNARVTQAAIDELPPDVTLSFVPYTADLQSWIDRARARGHEVMIELPMEPFDPEADDTGPQTLLANASARDNIARLENLLSRATGYFGVTNYQGARFAASGQASAPVAQALKSRGLVFLGNALGPRTAFGVEAGRAGLPFASADRIIDTQRDAQKIDEQLLNLEALALQNGSALGSGFAFPVTIDQIEAWAENLSMRGYVLAPASAVMESRTGRR
ncbi:MAG: divergent polysaccharide deacetylase family protein [Hyphomonadaceae bacterium]|nr:divergent polysaccharide deacetylase family protein [Hyphomonadaceae bacterium]